MGANGDDSSKVVQHDDSQRIYNGQESRVVDEKNRLTIPARWRDARYAEFHALPDSNNLCLKLLNADELRRMKRTLDDSTEFTPAQKKMFRRRWFSRAMPCPIDKQGRIVVPPELQERYKFAGDVMVVGACECLEIWRPEDWEREQAPEAEASVDSMAETLGF